MKELVIEGLNECRTADIEVRDTGTEHGRGVFATKAITKHTYICEYRVDVLTEEQSEKRKQE